MKGYFFIDCATEEIVRSNYEEENLRYRRQKPEATRFIERSPSEVIYKIRPEDTALPYPFLLTLIVEGRSVMGADVDIGWQHQGLEKSLESVNWLQAGHLLRRINPTINSAMGLAYRFSLEKLCGLNKDISVFERLIRVVVLESERILHHVYIVDRILKLVTGTSRRTLTKTLVDPISNICKLLASNPEIIATKLREIMAIAGALKESSASRFDNLMQSREIRQRLEGAGHIDRSHVLPRGLTGIYLRAAGFSDDVRANHPDLPYSLLDFHAVSRNESDAYARFTLRLLEIQNSLGLIQRACVLASEVEAPLLVADYQPGPGLVATSFIEAPEGELAVTLCSDGGPNPYRVRIKTPSFNLTSAVGLFLKGSDLDDVILLLSTLGINTLETDR